MQENENAGCEKYYNMIFDYFSDKLSEQDVKELMLHIEDCPDCRNEFSEIQTMIDAMSEIEDVEAPDEVKASVSAALEAEAKKVNKRIDFRRFAVSTFLPVAACAALAVGIYSGGLYDRFIGSDDIFSDDIKTHTEEALPEASTDVPVIEEDANAVSDGTKINENNTSNKADNINRNTSDKKSDNANEKKTETHISIEETEEIEETEGTEKAVDKMPDSAEDNSSADAQQYISEDAVSEDTASADEAISEDASNNIMRSVISGASGGGSGQTGNEDSGIAVASEVIDDKEAAVASAPVSEVEIAEAGSNTCIVTVDNPTEFAQGFGISVADSSLINFKISKERFREFVDYCRNTGALLEADLSDENGDYIDVTVIKGNKLNTKENLK